MYAVVVKVNISNPDSAREVLTSQIVPRVAAAPGFQAGYWTSDESRSNGISMVVFDSEENARAASEMVPQMVTEDVSVESVEVREVIASA